MTLQTLHFMLQNQTLSSIALEHGGRFGEGNYSAPLFFYHRCFLLFQAFICLSPLTLSSRSSVSDYWMVPECGVLQHCTLHSLSSLLHLHLAYRYYANECRHLVPASFLLSIIRTKFLRLSLPFPISSIDRDISSY